MPPPAQAAAAPSRPVTRNALPADIGANLLDRMYQGEYAAGEASKRYHPPDLDAVLQRAFDAGAADAAAAGVLLAARAHQWRRCCMR